MQALLQSVDLGISDICSVQECKKVQYAQLYTIKFCINLRYLNSPKGLDTGRASRQVYGPENWLATPKPMIKLKTHDCRPLGSAQMCIWICWEIRIHRADAVVWSSSHLFGLTSVTVVPAMIENHCSCSPCFLCCR
jgi:hypothetical protein